MWNLFINIHRNSTKFMIFRNQSPLFAVVLLNSMHGYFPSSGVLIRQILDVMSLAHKQSESYLLNLINTPSSLQALWVISRINIVELSVHLNVLPLFFFFLGCVLQLFPPYYRSSSLSVPFLVIPISYLFCGVMAHLPSVLGSLPHNRL